MSSDELVPVLTQKCLEQGLLVIPTRNQVVRLIPPLIVTKSELEEGVELLDSALSLIVQNH